MYWIAIALALVAALVFLMPLLCAFAVIGLWIHWEKKAYEVRTPSLKERLTFRPAELEEMARARADMERHRMRLTELSGMGEGLMRRADGRFDERSKLGRQLNEERDTVEKAWESARDTVTDIPYRPRRRSDDYVNVVVPATSLRIGVLGGVALFLHTVIGDFPHIDMAGEWIGDHALIDLLPWHHVYYAHSVIAAFAALVLWGVAYPFINSRVENERKRCVRAEMARVNPDGEQPLG